MTRTIYVPRVGGGTLIIQYIPAPPTSPITLNITAVFRSGTATATYRDGNVEASYRDGNTTTRGR